MKIVIVGGVAGGASRDDLLGGRYAASGPLAATEQ